VDVAEVVGRTLVAHGAQVAFGVVGSGNFHATNAMVAAGARFVAAAHENGAACMADAYARTSGRLTVVSVHQGPGVTNALTGITEAAKSHTPLVVLAPEATQRASNFFIDLDRLATAVGAQLHRVRRDEAGHDVAVACREASGGKTVLIGLPLDVQAQPGGPVGSPLPPVPAPRTPDVRALTDALGTARRPVFIAGRGSRGARKPLSELASRAGALLAVSAAAKGLFAGDPWDLDISGGFATPLAAELIGMADLVVGWGSTLNMWTTRHGALIHPDATVAQVDRDPGAIGRNRTVHIGVCGDVTAVATACSDALEATGSGWRTPELRERLGRERRWNHLPYDDDSTADHIDPRTLSRRLDEILPPDRTVVVDSGNFMGYPAAYLDVPDETGFCFTQAFQSIGLGLANAIGAALARPDRLTVAAAGDGGFLMAAAELATLARLTAPVVVVVYNDAAYGAEVHHFGPHGHPLDTVRFPDTDLAAIARGYGCEGLTVRTTSDLSGLARWLDGDRGRPLVVDAKVASARPSWWLEEAFRGTEPGA
jgi:thiamine pyrophosphate-dependent acetolactate synthase large subunit-like protein